MIVGQPAYAPPEEALVILHEDDDLLILDKPSGLLTVPGKTPDLADCLESRVQAHCADATMVHRLDRDTSGIVVIAKTPRVHRHLGLQFERRHVVKRYVARVQGNVASDSGIIERPLISDWPNRPKQKTCDRTGRAARTDWQVIGRETGATRLALTPLTGRTHQLRVHMLSMGHPILGDVLYAPPEVVAAAARLQLHAETLILRHPSGGRPCTFHSPCPF